MAKPYNKKSKDGFVSAGRRFLKYRLWHGRRRLRRAKQPVRPARGGSRRTCLPCNSSCPGPANSRSRAEWYGARPRHVIPTL